MGYRLWQVALVDVADCVNEWLNKLHIAAAGPSPDGQASVQPDAAGRDLN